ncbi:hypothetical protein HN51_063067 [Arachis hypogaea]|uniref:Transmembrane protein n=1 Tax=Arachis hypogaea TaxID=3818 RepID=A0A445AZL3_ARAHY|nr:uncharacterized protein LOC107633940 [Arachis ipaensis]XP_025629371.1 uncharacterized protein LOC112722528 [Arachis hypogaea]QHO20633.1 uncharacterized protein DS421_11g339670 [Arachis hypogaea]RYR31858.1 hypothetical protein Ahy_B01g056792 [Arachis hypogaea]
MEDSSKILRRSIHCFLQNYHYFTSTVVFLVLPFSVSLLLSQALVPSPSSLLPQVYNRLKNLFDAAGFPPSELFTILNLKVSQTITSSIFTLPFTLTFLLIAKASIIITLNQHKRTLLPPSFGSIFSLYKPLLQTYICNCFLILSANATAFGLLFLAFSCVEGLGYSSQSLLLFLSTSGAVLFSVILANALVICNMALALSGMEGHGGYLAILKACVMIREKTSMALFLALPVNVALAAIEALFQFRIVRTYHIAGKAGPYVALEGIFIAYLYSIFVIIDTIVSCMFYKSFKTGSSVDQEFKNLLIEFQEEDNYGFIKNKNFEELP